MWATTMFQSKCYQAEHWNFTQKILLNFSKAYEGKMIREFEVYRTLKVKISEENCAQLTCLNGWRRKYQRLQRNKWITKRYKGQNLLKGRYHNRPEKGCHIGVCTLGLFVSPVQHYLSFIIIQPWIYVGSNLNCFL